MTPPVPDPAPIAPRTPLVAVVDACVFPRRDWLNPIRDSARSGHVVPIWSPLIISEATRFHTWRWLQEHRGDLSRGARRDCSTELKHWFAEMTAMFRVAEDCPPHEATWDLPRDAWDVPVWNAAKRSGAHVIVTANLRDGPPEDQRSRRHFQGILWCHPEIFARVLDRWADTDDERTRLNQDDSEREALIRARLLERYDAATSAGG